MPGEGHLPAGRMRGSRPSSPLLIAGAIFSLVLAGQARAGSQGSSSSDRPEPRSVRAELIRVVSPPGSANGFLRPSTMCIDRSSGELYVVDPGKHRIVVFDESGTYRFEFSAAAGAAPSDIAIDRDGLVYLLFPSSQGAKILAYDFDGAFLNRVNLGIPEDGVPVEPKSIAIDEQNRLFVLDETNVRICSADLSGALHGVFPLLSGLSEKERHELVFGAVRVDGDNLLVPVSSLGSIYLYGVDGTFRKAIGHQGSTPGELAFPVAAAVNDGVLLVLDKHRFVVSCFDLAGRFLGEFGGQGASPGWFYHPTFLDVDRLGQVYVGQVFLNRVQVCRIPEFIVAGAHHDGPEREQAVTTTIPPAR